MNSERVPAFELPNDKKRVKRMREQLAMIRSSRDAGCDEEAREYERNIANEYAGLLAERDRLKRAMRERTEELMELEKAVTEGRTVIPHYTEHNFFDGPTADDPHSDECPGCEFDRILMARNAPVGGNS